MKLKKGDEVLVIRGKDKGKLGKILEIYPKTNQAKVDGINVARVHKKNASDAKKTGVFDEFMPINLSKLGLPHGQKKNKSSRIGFKVNAKGEKVRILKATGKEV